MNIVLGIILLIVLLIILFFIFCMIEANRLIDVQIKNEIEKENKKD